MLKKYILALSILGLAAPSSATAGLKLKHAFNYAAQAMRSPRFMLGVAAVAWARNMVDHQILDESLFPSLVDDATASTSAAYTLVTDYRHSKGLDLTKAADPLKTPAQIRQHHKNVFDQDIGWKRFYTVGALLLLIPIGLDCISFVYGAKKAIAIHKWLPKPQDPYARAALNAQLIDNAWKYALPKCCLGAIAGHCVANLYRKIAGKPMTNFYGLSKGTCIRTVKIIINSIS